MDGRGHEGRLEADLPGRLSSTSPAEPEVLAHKRMERRGTFGARSVLVIRDAADPPPSRCCGVSPARSRAAGNSAPEGPMNRSARSVALAATAALALSCGDGSPSAEGVVATPSFHVLLVGPASEDASCRLRAVVGMTGSFRALIGPPPR